jgi:hypothetical protein
LGKGVHPAPSFVADLLFATPYFLFPTLCL